MYNHHIYSNRSTKKIFYFLKNMFGQNLILIVLFIIFVYNYFKSMTFANTRYISKNTRYIKNITMKSQILNLFYTSRIISNINRVSTQESKNL